MKKKCPVCKECLDFKLLKDGTLEYCCILCGIVYELVPNEGLVQKGKKDE
jgi:hypothetical protein